MKREANPHEITVSHRDAHSVSRMQLDAPDVETSNKGEMTVPPSIG